MKGAVVAVQLIGSVHSLNVLVIVSTATRLPQVVLLPSRRKVTTRDEGNQGGKGNCTMIVSVHHKKNDRGKWCGGGFVCGVTTSDTMGKLFFHVNLYVEFPKETWYSPVGAPPYQEPPARRRASNRNGPGWMCVDSGTRPRLSFCTCVEQYRGLKVGKCLCT